MFRYSLSTSVPAAAPPPPPQPQAAPASSAAAAPPPVPLVGDSITGFGELDVFLEGVGSGMLPAWGFDLPPSSHDPSFQPFQ